MKVFEGHNVSEVWGNAYNHLLNKENSKPQFSRMGDTLEVMKCCFSIENSRDRWTLYRKPMISPAFAITEIFWILDGNDEANFINTWNPIFRKFAGKEQNYHGAYGHRLIHNLGFNQLQRVYETLKNNPESRQCVLQIWDGNKDLPKISGKPNSEDIPCNLTASLKIRDNKLEWSQIMRSNDLFRGTPYNFIQFSTLQEIIAGWLGIGIGEYFYFTDSLHVYKHDLGKFSKRENLIDLKNPDKLLFSKEEFDTFFPRCISILKKIYKNGLEYKDIINLKADKIIPQEYKNLLSLSLAYIGLKNKQFGLVQDCELICNNELLLTVWNTWKEERYGNI